MLSGWRAVTHNVILIDLIWSDHICSPCTLNSLLIYNIKQGAHPCQYCMPTCIIPHLSIHPRYVSDRNIIWSNELGCNPWVSGSGGVGGVVRTSLTDVAAQPRQPQEDDQIENNPRQSKTYILTLHTGYMCWHNKVCSTLKYNLIYHLNEKKVLKKEEKHKFGTLIFLVLLEA